MPDIRYICLSDLHFGDDASLLTNLKEDSSDIDPVRPSPVMEQLVECLGYLIGKNDGEEKPTLILNGDILELALNTENQAIMVFERFIELIMPEGGKLFKDIVFVPGNHDHHLWEIARENQYLRYITKAKVERKIEPFDPDELLDIPWHTTNMFGPEPIVDCRLLTQVVQWYKHLEGMVVATAYPNYGLIKGNSKCIVFHHGHLIESIYQIMSTLKTWVFPTREQPRDIWDIEAENFAWIDFFWSTLGRSGEVGQDVELVYHKLQSPEQLKELISNLVDKLRKEYGRLFWGWAVAKGMKWVLNAVVDKIMGLEKHQADTSLSEKTKEGLKKYMAGPLKDQILIENRQNMPSDMTFVFGHTHKPFQKDMDISSGYNQWVNVYNSGGWVVDTVANEPCHGGSIILVDENLDATSIQMYREGNYLVEVKESKHESEPSNPFHRRILELVNPAEGPWKTFSDIVEGEVDIRSRNLQAKIDSED